MLITLKAAGVTTWALFWWLNMPGAMPANAAMQAACPNPDPELGCIVVTPISRKPAK